MQDAWGMLHSSMENIVSLIEMVKIELRWYEQADYEISASRYYDDLKKSESLFKLGRIQCAIRQP